MTISFTLGKRFYKTLNYILRFGVIIVVVVNIPELIARAIAIYTWYDSPEDLHPLVDGGPPMSPTVGDFLLYGTPVVIWLILLIGLVMKFNYRPKNVYVEESPTPKDDLAFWTALPKNILEFYAGAFLLIFLAKITHSDDEYPNLTSLIFWYSKSYFHLLLIGLSFFRTKNEYDEMFDEIWPENSNEVTLIIEHRSLLDGKSPDGLAHLKEGDLVKLVPSDVPAEEKSTINIINERTPNGPVLMDRIFSKSLVKRLESTHIGYMYGEVSRFKAANHIELTLSKDNMPLRSDYRDFDGLDELFREAALLVVQTQQGSTSMIQRKLELGYNRAGRIIDQLEAKGIIGPHQGSRAREVLIDSEEELQKRLDEIDNET